MASRLVTTSFAIASAAVLLAGCDSISNMFGHNSSQSSGSSGIARSATPTGSGAPSHAASGQPAHQAYGADTSSGYGSTGTYGSTGSAAGMSNPAAMESVSADKVKRAQQALKDQGLYKGPIDGIVGPQTRDAVAHYQRAHNLTQNAMLDDQTLRSLDSRMSSNTMR